MPSPINLFDPAFREDPYPFYAESRARAPVAQIDPFGAWLVTGYDAVVEVLRNPSIYSSAAMRGAMTQIELADSEDDGPPPHGDHHRPAQARPPAHARQQGIHAEPDRSDRAPAPGDRRGAVCRDGRARGMRSGGRPGRACSRQGDRRAAGRRSGQVRGLQALVSGGHHDLLVDP